jgi:predicted DNA-binding transcriptional regulator YafY
MKIERRKALARESFPEKMRKVGQLRQLSSKFKAQRERMTSEPSCDRAHEAHRNPLILSAIQKKAVLRFTYNGKLRTVEPQTYGLSTAGREVLRAFERNTRRLGIAKLFDVEKITGAERTGEKFDQALPTHKPQDSAMTEIFATLPFPKDAFAPSRSQ